MATIGLDEMYYAKITSKDDADEVYDTPKKLAGAISVDIAKNIAEAMLSADNRTYYANKSFSNGTITINLADISDEALVDIFGAVKDSKGGIAFSGDKLPEPVALGFRAMKANGKYRYTWLLRVVFAPPGENVQTQGDAITYTTPTVTGTFSDQIKKAADGHHYHQYKMDEDAENADAATIKSWYTQVQEPSVSAA